MQQKPLPNSSMMLRPTGLFQSKRLKEWERKKRLRWRKDVCLCAQLRYRKKKMYFDSCNYLNNSTLMFAMTSTFPWQNSISLFPVLFCNPMPNLLVTPGVSWFPTFAFQSPIMKRRSFLIVSSRRSSRSSQNSLTSASSALLVGA